MSDRATLDEVLDFANAVREAGGGNPLDALMPAIPQDSSQCLIARNLNFNCSVAATNARTTNPVIEGAVPEEETWVMEVNSKDIRDRIAESLDLEKLTTRRPSGMNQHFVILPVRIAAVAIAFDDVQEWIYLDEDINEDTGEWVERWEIEADVRTDPEKRAMFLELFPYIERSEDEARLNATFINEKGEIVL